MVENKNCLFCGTILSGRSDKKYCDDNCRNNYHYRLKKDSNIIIKSINASLIKNREILKSFITGIKTVVLKEKFVELNFDFDVMTNIYKTSKGLEYKVVYDYAYRIVNEYEVLIIKYC